MEKTNKIYKDMTKGMKKQFYPLLFLLLSLFVPHLLVQIVLIFTVYLLLILESFKRNTHIKLAKKLSIIILFTLLATFPILFTKRAAYLSNFSISSWIVTEQSFRAFLLIFIRCLVCIGSILLLTTLCPLYLIMHKMRELKFPILFIELMELTYRYIYILVDTAKQVFLAQESRLGYNGYSNKIKDTGTLFAQTFVLTLHNADNVYKGLLSKGYDYALTETKMEYSNDEKDLNIIELNNIHYTYPDSKSEIIKGISFQVQKGEKVVLLGENGAGKSTLFHILNGINIPQEGEYHLGSLAFKNKDKVIREFRKRVGVIFQNPDHQLFTPSVADEIAFGLRNLGFKGSELEEKVDRILLEFDLIKIMDLPPHLLSQGQKKWVAIASVVAMNPDVLLLDEPTADLDKFYTSKVWGLLEKLHRNEKTIIVITHDMDFAFKWANRGLVLHNGKLIADAPIYQIFSTQETIEKANLDQPKISHNSKIKLSSLKTKQDKFIPLFLSTKYHKALIIGGGKGAYRKAQTFISNNITTHIVAPNLIPEIKQLIDNKKATYSNSQYNKKLIWSYTLVVAATGNEDLDITILKDCLENNILVNILSNPSLSTFQMGAGNEIQGVQFAVHSNFKLPIITQVLRDEISKYLQNKLSYDDLQTLSKMRENLKTSDEENLRIAYNNYKNKVMSELKKD